MAAKKRKKSIARKTSTHTKNQINGLRRIGKFEELNSLGAREKVISSYFSTLYYLTRNRQAWGNSASYYLGSNFALNPEELFDLGESIDVEPGATYEIQSETVLVVKGETHSLLVMISGQLYPPTLKPINWRKSLTLSSAFKCIKSDDYTNAATIFLTTGNPRPIAVDETKSWSLVIGSGNQRAWRLSETGNYQKLSVSSEELRLHSYFNLPYEDWKFVG
jgi:hypothetical protein